ncbi:MAG: hypothetical protein J6N47_08860 [Lachnospiraceae bacterium]|nr:hypothetical protein [Lachnospiraceae bacterium]
MGRHYKNFKAVVYIPAQIAESFTEEKLASDYDFIEKYIGLDKVYLETHRENCDVDEKQLRMVKSFLEGKGVEVSGGITTVIDDFEGAEPDKQRLFGVFCYSDPAMRTKLKEICEFTAKIFDEVILDDFYFTNCTCERCNQARGDRSWADFRRELMMDVSENLVVKPMKAVNPKVRTIIKYPNWRESYHFTGYVPEVEHTVFDATYTGTETRSETYTDQHLPPYLSYSLFRYLDNAWPGRNGGGWFDTYQCWSVDRYLEQAYLTAFAGAGELTHFMWQDLIDSHLVAAMGIQLGKIDRLLSEGAKPVGVPVYIPYASSGENHLEMRLGMLGIPMEPTPYFPEGAQRILFTESSIADDGIVEKIESFVRNGGDAVITTGFLREAGQKLREAGLTEARLSGNRYAVTRYHVTDDPVGYYEHREPVLFPEIVHGNNVSWSLLNGGDGELSTSIFLRCTYGKGRLYIMSVPDNASDLYRMPSGVLDVARRILTGGDFVSGRNVSVFTYDDGSMMLYRYVREDIHTDRVVFHTGQKVSGLVDMVSGQRIPARKVTRKEDYVLKSEYVAEVLAIPGIFNKYRWEKTSEDSMNGDGNEDHGKGCSSLDLWSSRQPES